MMLRKKKPKETRKEVNDRVTVGSQEWRKKPLHQPQVIMG